MTINKIGLAGFASYSFDPAAYGADNTGAANGRAAWLAAINAAVTRAASNGGVVHIKPSPGTYRIDWDGSTGWDSGLGIAVTSLNYRSCLVIDDASVTKVVFDFTGVKILLGGANKNEWASTFFVANADVEIIGGEYDFVNQPFTQGTISAIGADYVEFDIDPDFDTQTPSFAQISEILTYSAVSYSVNLPNNRYVKQFALNRDEYTDSYAPLVYQSGSTYRVTGLSGDEITTITSRAPVGTYVAVRGMADGCCWFSLMDCQNVAVRDDPLFHTALMRCIFANACGRTSVRDMHVRPRPDSKALLCTGRGAVDVFNCLGDISVMGCDFYGTGDDAIGAVGFALSRMTKLSATTLSAFSNSHYFGITAKAGDRFILVDSTFATVATGVITDVSAITVSPNWLATYTVSLASGSLPSDMTNHMLAITRGHVDARVTGNTFTNIRGRGVWGNLPGEYDGNTFNWTTNQHVLIQPTAGGDAGGQTFYIPGARISIDDNICNSPATDSYYPSGLHLFGSLQDSAFEAAETFPYTNFSISRNQFSNCSQMAILVGGAQDGKVEGNIIVGANGSSEYGEETSYGFSTKTIIGYVNCRRVTFARNQGSSLASAALILGITHNTGTNSKIMLDENRNMDDTTPDTYFTNDVGIGADPNGSRLKVYKSGAGTELLIEADSTWEPSVRLKNGGGNMQIFASQYGLFFKDVTAGANRMAINQDGVIVAGADNTYDFGYSGASRFRVFYAANRFEAPAMAISSAAGTSRQLRYQTSGVARWYVAASNETESGANAGSNFLVTRYDDSGVYIDSPLSITRATGVVTLLNGASTNGSYKISATDVITSSRHHRLRSYTVATLPTATAQEMIYVSDGAGGKRLAVADGTNWRFPDGNIVS